MKKEDLKNGFMFINGGKYEPLPYDFFDAPSEKREEEIIEQLTEEMQSKIKQRCSQTQNNIILTEKEKESFKYLNEVW